MTYFVDKTQQSFGSFFASLEGKILSRQICSLIDASWPSLEEKCVLTIGYATPFTRFLEQKGVKSLTEIDFENSAEKTFALKTSEKSFPFRDQTFDAVFMFNGLEKACFPKIVLQETRRILKNDGSFFLVSANRQLPWSCVKNSPVIDGTHRSGAEIIHLLSENTMLVCQQKQTLFFPSWIYRHFPKAEKYDYSFSFLTFGGSFIVTTAVKTPAVSVPVHFQKRFKNFFSLTTADSRKSVTESSLKK